MRQRGQLVGAVKCAERLTERLVQLADADDIRVLAEQGHLEVVDTFTPPDGGDAHALFDTAVVDRVTSEMLTAASNARISGATGTLNEQEAAKALGYAAGPLRIAMYAKKIQPNPVGRFARADVEALVADGEFQALMGQVGPR